MTSHFCKAKPSINQPSLPNQVEVSAGCSQFLKMPFHPKFLKYFILAAPILAHQQNQTKEEELQQAVWDSIGQQCNTRKNSQFGCGYNLDCVPSTSMSTCQPNSLLQSSLDSASCTAAQSGSVNSDSCAGGSFCSPFSSKCQVCVTRYAVCGTGVECCPTYTCSQVEAHTFEGSKLMSICLPPGESTLLKKRNRQSDPLFAF